MRFIALISRAHGQDKPRAYCEGWSRIFDPGIMRNAVVWLVGLQSLQCRTVNSADMLLARCSITITGWITNRLCRLRVHALVDMAFAVGSVGTGDRVASLVWGQKIAPS